MNAYLREIYCRCGERRKKSDNGSDFKNSLLVEVASQLGIKHIQSSPYRSLANGQIDAIHKFLENCIGKFTSKGKGEWDEVLNIACVIYNFFPNSQCQESVFMLLPYI